MAEVRVWIDLANSPHVPLAEPIVRALRRRGDEVVLTARDHAQTVELARRRWPELRVIGGSSPPGRAKKALAIAARANELRRFARRERPDVAFSHGSYAQVVAARSARVPSLVMMDYEHQPANHVSFRLASRVLVPEVFPAAALKKFGARPATVGRYPGFKEELYLSGFAPARQVLDDLDLDPAAVIAVFRPPPEGALYHRMANERFDRVLDDARERGGVQIVLLPRTPAQSARYADGLRIPAVAVDGSSLLALADLLVGAGGTMNRESAILGTPTYTVFAGALAAVDAELIRQGRMHDLRDPGSKIEFVKKPVRPDTTPAAAREEILSRVLAALDQAAGRDCPPPSYPG
jgi:predicted glycosyltransferase